MKNHPFTSTIKSSRGVTLVELIIATALLSIVVLGAVALFRTSQRAYSSTEAQVTLKSLGQASINHIGLSLSQSKRFFENTATGTSYLSRVTLTGGPSALSGSQLPTITVNGSLSPGNTDFVSASVGNQIFLSVLEPAQDLTVLNSGGVSGTVRIDTYHFNYYYLSADSTKRLGGAARIDLREWRSPPYADRAQLLALTDAVQRSNAVIALRSGGIVYAWDPGQNAVTSAFYNLNSNGTIVLVSTHTLPSASNTSLTKTLTGILGGGFRVGVSPNTSAAFNTAQTVPEFAAASGLFPSGFEITIIGPNSARQVFTRLVLGAEGSFSGPSAHEEVLLRSCRDVW